MLLLDLTRFGNQKRIERIALAVINIVVDYQRRYRNRNPNAPRIGENPVFKKLAHETGFARNQMQLSRRVKDELIAADFFSEEATGLGTE